MTGRHRLATGAKLARLIWGSALAGLMAACAPDLDLDPSTWPPAPPPPANKIVHRHAALHLAAPADPILRAHELARLDAFLLQAAPGASARAELRESGAPALAAAAEARLRQAGIPAAHIRHLTPVPDAPPGLDIRLDDVAVVVPRCTGDSEEGGFGCATTRALGLMLADPRDLERGQASSPPTADLPAAAVMRQRQDKVKPLPTDQEGMTP